MAETRYPHPTVNRRMATLRVWANANGREPSTAEAAQVLEVTELSAAGYVAAIKRESIKALDTNTVAERTGLSARRVQELALQGVVGARRTTRGWRYTEESIQTIVTRRTLEIQG